MLYGITGDCLDCILWLIIGSRFRKSIHASLLTMSICARIIIAVAFQKIDDAPNAKTAAKRRNKRLKNIDCGIKKLHI